MVGVLVNQEISILLNIVHHIGRVTRHEVVVEIVIAPHPHKEYAFWYPLFHHFCTQIG